MCRVTIGHFRVTKGHLWLTIGHIRVTVGHSRVTIGYLFFSELIPKVRQTCLKLELIS